MKSLFGFEFLHLSLQQPNVPISSIMKTRKTLTAYLDRFYASKSKKSVIPASIFFASGIYTFNKNPASAVDDSLLLAIYKKNYDILEETADGFFIKNIFFGSRPDVFFEFKNYTNPGVLMKVSQCLANQVNILAKDLYVQQLTRLKLPISCEHLLEHNCRCFRVPTGTSNTVF